MAGNNTNVGTDIINISASEYLVNGASIEVVGNPFGFILASPNGSRWLIQVNNSGTLSTTAAPAVP
jgi:hypothetical protein